MDNFKLYINTDNKFKFYGCGNIKYIMELFNDYLSINDMYGQSHKEFKVERFSMK